MANEKCEHTMLRRSKTGGWFCYDRVDCDFSIPEPAPEPPAGEPAHWSRMREICTCPKPGTSNSQIDPMCPLAFPHPWDRKHPNRT